MDIDSLIGSEPHVCLCRPRAAHSSAAVAISAGCAPDRFSPLCNAVPALTRGDEPCSLEAS